MNDHVMLSALIERALLDRDRLDRVLRPMRPEAFSLDWQQGVRWSHPSGRLFMLTEEELPHLLDRTRRLSFVAQPVFAHMVRPAGRPFTAHRAIDQELVESMRQESRHDLYRWSRRAMAAELGDAMFNGLPLEKSAAMTQLLEERDVARWFPR